jgi:DNA polymerase III delta subunit
MLYLITGPDALLVRAALREIRERHDPAGLNTSVIDARPGNVEEIVIALGTPGFFGGDRVVIVNDLMTLGTKGAAAIEDDGDENLAKQSVDWPRLFGAVQPGVVAVFVDRQLHSAPATVKKAVPADAEFVAADPPRGGRLISWIQARAKQAESNIDQRDAQRLAELLCPGTWGNKPSNPAYDRPPDLEQFANEVDKLALAAHPGPITRGHIDEMTTMAQADRLFPLVDAVMAGDAAGACRELGRSLADDGEAARIGAQLNQQVELLAVLSAASGRDPVETGRALGLSNPNRMIAVAKSLRSVGRSARPMLQAALETERAMKSGTLRRPTDGLYALVDDVLSIRRQTREGGR